MNSYTTIFGGENVNPTQLSYIAYRPLADLTLVWPLEAPPDANVAADKIDVFMTAGALSVIMPPADQISVGQDVLIRNTGVFTFSVRNNDGIEIGSVASGEAWYFVVISNSTTAGQWYAIEFGVGTSAATAASLAGAGLRANVNVLDQNLPTTSVIADRTVTEADRATVLQNDDGTVTWLFDPAATLGDGFFVYVINAGGGSITLTPTGSGSPTIDGHPTKVIAPTESLIVFSNGTDLRTLGYGRNIIDTITGTSINVAGSGDLFLTSTEVAAQVQDYVGTLTGDRAVFYGNTVGYWFVFNNTSGAHTLTLKVDTLDPGALIKQGNFSIIRSNGTNMEIAFTDTFGTVTEVDTGTGLQGGPITTTGTISMTDTGVAADSYGDVTQTLLMVVDAQGRITSLTAISISIPISQVQPMTSAQLAARVSDETGTGALVFAVAPSIGTPATITLTNATGLPVSTGISGLGTGVATFLATPNSANLAAALTDETGTGSAVFGTAPTLSNPIVGTQAQDDNSTKGASTAYVDRIGVQQIVSAFFPGFVTTAGTGIPVDNTIPQQTEGDEVMTLAITPKSATSRLVIDATVTMARNGGDATVMALFQDATANALSAIVGLISNEAGIRTMRWIMTSGTTSSTTFKIRVGSNTPAPLLFNGVQGVGAVMGGVSASSITITEYGV